MLKQKLYEHGSKDTRIPGRASIWNPLRSASRDFWEVERQLHEHESLRPRTPQRPSNPRGSEDPPYPEVPAHGEITEQQELKRELHKRGSFGDGGRVLQGGQRTARDAGSRRKAAWLASGRVRFLLFRERRERARVSSHTTGGEKGSLRGGGAASRIDSCPRIPPTLCVREHSGAEGKRAPRIHYRRIDRRRVFMDAFLSVRAISISLYIRYWRNKKYAKKKWKTKINRRWILMSYLFYITPQLS